MDALSYDRLGQRTVPEPATFTLLGAGLVWSLVTHRRNRRARTSRV
ncbi:MAG: hypothetical protein DMD96_08885 [Candidatus Rokuibacteriota bacterium]|nr:MAG: hypothetical protein DMD96_08885 [Candidatus Rokubacteria bacterium]